MFNSLSDSVVREAVRPLARPMKWVQTFIAAAVALAVAAHSRPAFAETPAAGSSASKSKLSYNRDIRPVLSENCFYCHGPDPNKRKGKLRLDVRAEALAKQAIVPGKPNESELVRRIFTKDTDDLMPPPESHKILTPAQKELLRRWIAEGAEYQSHWAYVPPLKPPVPADRNGIDFLVQQRLKEIGLQPSPEADQRTLARRLSVDLVGLPPDP